MIVSTLGIWRLERDQKLSLIESGWFTVVTMTTVGYGDISPKTDGGKLFTAVVPMIGGIGFMAYLLSVIATTIIERELKTVSGLSEVKRSGHILILNCPNEEKVHAIIDELRVDNKSQEVAIVLIADDFDTCPDQLMKRKNFFFVKGNPLLLRTLDRANASQASQAVLLAKDPKSGYTDGLTTQVALSLNALQKTAGSNIYIVAEVVNRDSIGPLQVAGVNDIVCLEDMIPPILVQSLLDPGIPDVLIHLSSKLQGQQLYVTSIPAEAMGTYGDFLKRVPVVQTTKVICVGVLRDGAPIINPPDTLQLELSDKLVYIAEKRLTEYEFFG